MLATNMLISMEEYNAVKRLGYCVNNLRHARDLLGRPQDVVSRCVVMAKTRLAGSSRHGRVGRRLLLTKLSTAHTCSCKVRLADSDQQGRCKISRHPSYSFIRHVCSKTFVDRSRRLLSDHVRPSADLAGPEDCAKRDELRLNWEQRSTDPLEYTKSADL
jgi:hypothetical protein